MKIKEDIRLVISYLKEAFFPLFCIKCGKEKNILCDDCFDLLDLKGILCCPICHSQNNDGKCCFKCIDKSYLNQHIAILQYNENNIIGKLIYEFKYNFVEDTKITVKKILIDFILHTLYLKRDIDFIVPVPLHPKRYAERGFNQSEEIAKAINKITGIPLLNILKRKKYTKQQAKLSKYEREQNVRDAFEFYGDKKNLSTTTILLVDDVFTTGSTLQACAKILKENVNVREIIGFSLARG